MRNRSRARVAFSSGDTNSLYVTIEAGAVYFEENLDLTGVIIYLQSDSSGQVAEILEWT
jgi:non-canonical (house-cleaning) NTP pyrophosphatase